MKTFWIILFATTCFKDGIRIDCHKARIFENKRGAIEYLETDFPKDFRVFKGEELFLNFESKKSTCSRFEESLNLAEEETDRKFGLTKKEVCRSEYNFKKCILPEGHSGYHKAFSDEELYILSDGKRYIWTTKESMEQLEKKHKP